MQPHIIFPQQAITEPKSKPLPLPKLKTPPIQKKARWLTERFQDLLGPAQLSTQPEFWPERTLVFETIGSVENFYNALKELPRYKFLLAELGDEIDPDDDYYLEQANEKLDRQLSTTLYFSMVNRDSLGKICEHWDAYQKDENYKFPRGFAALKQIFAQLKSIRFWGTEDRLNVSGLREDLMERIQYGEEIIPIEIELWFHSDPNARTHYERKVRAELTKINATVVSSCQIKEIGYHALLGQISNEHITALLAGDFNKIDLVRCDAVMFFRPIGQCHVTINEQEADVELDNHEQDLAEDISPPVVAILDGYPMANHQALQTRLIIEDPFELGERYNQGENIHGTSMASLILHGDKKEQEIPLNRKVVLCPIMAPDQKDTYNKIRQEKIPEDHLPLDLIHILVRRILVGNQEQQAIAPEVKIINLSIGDHHRLFDNRMSPWARLLDWLSYTYNVLFVVSAGNHADLIELDVTTSVFQGSSEEEREQQILMALKKNASMRRLRSPAEAINVLSVGALHYDACDATSINPNQVNPFTTTGMPSPLNPLSWGKKRSVKPEILMPGGRQTYHNRNKLFDNRNVMLQPLFSPLPPGLLTAAPGSVPGKINAYIYTAGTSNATALATRKLAQLYETLNDLSFAPRGNQLEKKAEAVLLKALLCHGAQPNDAVQIIEDIIRSNGKEKRIKANIARFFGYGAVNSKRLFGCENNQATLLRSGVIKHGEQHRFQLPLPPSLASKTPHRRLIVTLAWFSPIAVQRNHYREAKCWFSIVDDSHTVLLGTDGRHYDGNMIKNGTLQHEVFYGERAGVFTANNILEIDVNCKIKDENLKTSEIRFGLIVTLDTHDVSIPIYHEVKQGIDNLVAQANSIDVENRQ